MTELELRKLLNRLLAEPAESEWLEFKANRFERQELGEYLSALANGASLAGKPKGYIVFGIQDETHTVVGTDFHPEKEKGSGNQELILWLKLGLQPNVGFEHFVFTVNGKRVVLFAVNAASDSPVKFYGAAYIRVGSCKVTLAKHPDKERALWQRRFDWSALVCPQATLDDLEPEAIAKARHEYAAKLSRHRTTEIASWDDVTFLNKAKLTIQGQITNSALILLGREEATSLLAPSVALLTWVLKDDANREQDYEHFAPPLLLAVDRLLAKIRNLILRAMPSGTLFPVELPQYDTWVLREALHNCIAHQDYSIGGRVNVVEFPDRLLFSNQGSFLPGTVENVILQDAPPEVYRNPFLAGAMVNLNMIDTQGGGIKRMFTKQASRFFPLPDYDLKDPNRVAVTINGRILDEQYTQLLMQRTDLPLSIVMLLDRVQKKASITRDEHRILKMKGLVEGRYPALLISGRVAAVVGDKAQHIIQRGFNQRYYLDIIRELIRLHGPVDRSEIDRLLMDKLPGVLSDRQKKTKIHNLLSVLSKSGEIVNVGSRRYSRWQNATDIGKQQKTIKQNKKQ
ncbi:MAG TPA: putative DNA binding domain-containing protein [Lentisphaeria bacterium]|nr:transcriptional regulator [Lentisphaerota bacterium]OQC17654.1 MAG: Divergent AAA domain protein [Lentisphaerae bacterium ADurb.Bin082]HQC51778.1 putative DNA binding domain-containing protein [Lentisphaeria bacterium]